MVRAASMKTTSPAVISATERIRAARRIGESCRIVASSPSCKTPAPVEATSQHVPIASYEADPAEVDRVLLLYSGGLDTSVMLHWIQERYGAEIVTLTVHLGQPGEDWEQVIAKARDMGAVATELID